MRLLADENIDASLAAWLRHCGHDVLWVAEDEPGASDADVLSASKAADRVLLTFDLDFGEWVFRRRAKVAGIVLLRSRAPSAAELLERFQGVWPEVEPFVQGTLAVVANDRIRVRPIHSAGESGGADHESR